MLPASNEEESPELIELRELRAEQEAKIKCYHEVIELLGDGPSSLGSKLTHDIMVPLCGSQKVLVPGKIIHTNTVMIAREDDPYYVEQLASHAKVVIEGRCAKALEFRDALDALLGGNKERPDDKERPEVESPAADATASKEEFNVRKTPEGYVEIVERFGEPAPDVKSTNKGKSMFAKQHGKN